MSVSGISSNLFALINPSVQGQAQPIQNEFRQFGEDLQSGNPSVAEPDYATLERLVPQNNTTSSSSPSPSSNPLTQAFNELG